MLAQASAGSTALQPVIPTRGLLLRDAGQEDEELVTVRAAPDERHLGVAEHAKTLFPGLVPRRHHGVGSVTGMNPEAVDRRLGAVESGPPIQSRPSVRHGALALGRALDST